MHRPKTKQQQSSQSLQEQQVSQCVCHSRPRLSNILLYCRCWSFSSFPEPQLTSTAQDKNKALMKDEKWILEKIVNSLQSALSFWSFSVGGFTYPTDPFRRLHCEFHIIALIRLANMIIFLKKLLKNLFSSESLKGTEDDEEAAI